MSTAIDNISPIGTHVSRAGARAYNNNNYNHTLCTPAVKALYQEVFGRPLPSFVAAELDEYDSRFAIDPSLIEAVIEYTAVTAPRPTWLYARTVLNEQMSRFDVKDRDGFLDSCNAYYQSKARRCNPDDTF